MTNKNTVRGSSELKLGTLFYYLSVGCAAISFLIGFLVLLDWHTGLNVFFPREPQSIPFQYNTALAICLTCLALYFLFHQTYEYVSRIFGLIIGTIGLITLVQYTNPAVKSILGYYQNEVTGKDVLTLISQKDQSQFLEEFKQTINKKKGWRGLTIQWQHHDGSYLWLEGYSDVILDKGGEVASIVGSGSLKTFKNAGKNITPDF